MLKKIFKKVQGLWTMFPIDAVAAWVGLFWAFAIWNHSGEAQNAVHQYMNEVMSLNTWGFLASLIPISTVAWNHFGVGSRFVTLLYASFFFWFVTSLFVISGTSLTGWGTYLTLAVACSYTAVMEGRWGHDDLA